MNNNEFKKSKNGQYTVYTLESATGGSTSAASMGSVSKPMGGVQRRGDNLITQEGDKDKIDASKPRNFVAKNAKTGGAGAHKDKKKEQKQGNEKHKKPYMEDHEVSMASNELKSIHSDAQKLLGLVQQYGENGDLQAWQQSKITKAADYLNSVLQSIGGEQDTTEGYYDLNDMQPIDLSSNPSFKEIVDRYTQLYYQSHEGDYGDEESAESDAIEQYVAKRFGQKGSDHLQKAAQASFRGRDDGHGQGHLRSSNLGRPNQPSGDFRTTKAGKMHRQDAKVIKSRVADRLGRHPEPNLPEGVAEAPDSNFVGFMNKALGQKTDTPPAKSPMPDFMKGAPIAGLDSMGYRAALNFGMKTLTKLTPTQKTKLSIKGEDGVVNWLASQARKQGLLITDEDDEDTQGKFMQEDLEEVQDFLPEVFKDPAIKSWAFVLTDGEPLPKAPVAGPFTVSINPGLPNDNGYANSDWKELDTLENLPDAVELAQGLAQRNPKQFVGIWAANGKNAGFYWPGEGWRGLKEGVAEGLSKRDQQDVAAIRAAIARLESQLNHPNADRDAIQQSIAHEKKRLALYGVTEAAYNPDTFVGKKGTYKGYGITQEGPRQWGISSSVRKFPTLDAAKRHIDKNLIAEGSRDDDEYGPAARDAWLKQRAYEKEYNKKKPPAPVKPANKSKEQGVAEGPELKKAKREYNQAAKDAGGDWAGAGKKIDNMKKGLRQKDVGKDKSVAETDGYMEGLMQKLAEKIPASAPVDVWVQDFQKADPNKYHQFKNKTPAKKAQMAVAASYAAKNPDKKK